MSQLDKALSIGPVGSRRCALLVIVREEVKGEFVFGEVELVDLFHAEELIELDRGFGVVDPEHGVVQEVFGGVGSHGCECSACWDIVSRHRVEMRDGLAHQVWICVGRLAEDERRL